MSSDHSRTPTPTPARTEPERDDGTGSSPREESEKGSPWYWSLQDDTELGPITNSQLSEYLHVHRKINRFEKGANNHREPRYFRRPYGARHAEFRRFEPPRMRDEVSHFELNRRYEPRRRFQPHELFEPSRRVGRMRRVEPMHNVVLTYSVESTSNVMPVPFIPMPPIPPMPPGPPIPPHFAQPLPLNPSNFSHHQEFANGLVYLRMDPEFPAEPSTSVAVINQNEPVEAVEAVQPPVDEEEKYYQEHPEHRLSIAERLQKVFS